MKLSYLIVLLFCFAGLFVGCRKDSSNQSTGDTAKDFRLDTVAHDRFYLNQHRGKVVVLAFWTTWCRFCRSEMVELKLLADMPGANDLVIAAVCADPENVGDVKKAIEDLAIDYPVLLDRGGKVSRSYGISAFPTTVVIDKRGYMSFVRQGYSPVIMQQIRSKVAGLLAADERAK